LEKSEAAMAKKPVSPKKPQQNQKQQANAKVSGELKESELDQVSGGLRKARGGTTGGTF
jgi:hypothetical protein